MREAALVSARCCGAEKVLYFSFRSEPLLSQIFKSRWHVYEFFRALVELSSYGNPRSICVRRGEAAVAVAVYTVLERPRAITALRLLSLLLPALRWKALAELLRSARSFLTYVRALRGLEPRGHLLFIASVLRRRGYGSLLLEMVERSCERVGCRWLVLEVLRDNPAVLFYLRRGYRPTGSVDWLGARYLLMVKPLSPEPASGHTSACEQHRRLRNPSVGPSGG